MERDLICTRNVEPFRVDAAKTRRKTVWSWAQKPRPFFHASATPSKRPTLSDMGPSAAFLDEDLSW